MSEKRKPIPKTIRIQVHKKYNGHCAYCGCELAYKDMQVDHVVSVFSNSYYAMGNKKPASDILTDEKLNSIENFMPACRQCNFYKSTFSLEEFRERLQTMTDRLKNEYIYKLSLKYGLVEEHNEPVVFYFEKMGGHK